MLLLLWGLWCLTALMQGGTGLATFLPPSMEKLFRDFNNIMQQSRVSREKRKERVRANLLSGGGRECPGRGEASFIF